MNKLAILVVTYNRKELLKENMAAIFNQTCQEFDYYICDNASTDGTESIVKEQMRQHANLYYYNTGKNLGGAGGFSYGLKMIAQKDYDFCWLMDDDSIPQSDALEALARAADTLGKESFSYLGSTVLWMDGTPCVMNQFVPGTNVYDNLRATQNGLIPIEYGSFVGCFVNLLYTRKVGLPIKEFFIYGDDTEYTLRLHKEKPAYMCSQSVIIHKMDSNTRIGVSEVPVERISRNQYSYRNRIYVFRNRRGYSWFKILYLYAKECAKVIIRAKDHKWKRLETIGKGFFAGLRFHPDIEMVETWKRE